MYCCRLNPVLVVCMCAVLCCAMLCYVHRVHFALTVCYNLWVMWVLSRYFKDFVLVRQHYLSKGARLGVCVSAGQPSLSSSHCAAVSHTSLVSC